MTGFLVYLFIFAVYLTYFLRKRSAKKDGGARNREAAGRTRGSLGRTGRRTPARASDGHILRGKKDITCRQFGHVHDEDSAPRYLVHDDPEDGFIILNGVKMRISEADHYENSI